MVRKLEQGYIGLPAAAARLYDFVTSGGANGTQVRQIAEELTSRATRGRLLDVGPGPGRLLAELARQAPQLELFGLELSPAMLERARANLAHRVAELRCGSIEQTEYEDGFFDLVTCTGSLYIWHRPERCLDEIHRILKPGGTAVLFETCQDHDRIGYLRGLAAIIRDQGLVRGLIAPLFLTQQLRMTQTVSAYRRIVAGSAFAHSASIARVTLAQLPIWVRIVLAKRPPMARWNASA